MASESITCRCRHCGHTFRVKASNAGKKGRCPKEGCGQPVVVPQASAAKERPVKPRAASASQPLPSAGGTLPRGSAKAKSSKKSLKKPSASAGSPVPKIATAVVVIAIIGIGVAVTRSGDGEPAAAAVANDAAPVPAEPVVEAKPAGPPPFHEAITPFLEANCLDCHSGDEPEGDLNLALDDSTQDVLENRSRWEKAFDMIRIGAMPPPDYSTPKEEETEQVVAWLDNTLFFVDCEATPDPGRVTMRRLNRTEYTNTVQDLFGIKFDPAKGFPSDEVGYGFDNIGDVLTVPPLLLEKYLDAAEQITQKVILTGDPDIQYSPRDVNRLKTSGGAFAEKSAGQVVMSSSGATATYENAEFPRDAEYIVRVEAAGDQAGDEPVKLDVKVGDKSVGTVEVANDKKTPKSFDIRKAFKKGKRPISVTFTNDFYRKRIGDRNAFVFTVELIGPLGVDRSKLPKSHHELTKARPSKDQSAKKAAAKNLAPLLRRMFRRTVSDEEVSQFAQFAQLAADRGEPFEYGMQVAIQAALVSPQFLFRIESDDGTTGTLARRLSPFEVASRLSYFLWNTTPDDRLLDLAESNDLLRTEVLEAEVKRLLEDERSDEMIENFAGQWLGLRRLVEMSVDTNVYPQFSEQLRADMAEETGEFVRYVLRSGRPITELLSARYSFLNGRLAKHYGIDGVDGDKFRKVELKNGQRAGLLTHSSVLLLTSYPNRTSPVKRGEWILTNILGDEPPPAPPNVPTLEETQASAKDLTLREQMAKHREDPSCAACHKTMDALGFGFENYDGIGRWRDKDGKHPVDSSGELPSGEKFAGAVQLVDILSKREEKFVETFTERLLTFALGRGVEYTDKCVLDATVADARANGNSFASIVAAIVRSDAFRYQGSTLEKLPAAVATRSTVSR